MIHLRTKFIPYQILFLILLNSCTLNQPRSYERLPIPSYNRYYQPPANMGYNPNMQYNQPIPQQGFYDYDYSYTPPFGQNYNQTDY